jgi:hypothetical protein
MVVPSVNSKCILFLLALIGVVSSTKSYAVKERIILHPGSVNHDLWASTRLEQCQCPDCGQRGFGPFTEASTILSLSDGEDRECSNVYSLAKKIRLIAKPSAQVVATEIYYSEDLKTEGNIVYQKADNTKSLPFEDNKFDTIVGRRLLCYCDDKTKTCGGIDLVSEEGGRFLYEVARVLNKKNPHASVSISGIFAAKLGMSQHSFEEEQTVEEALVRHLLEVEHQFPSLETEMVYSKFPAGYEVYHNGAELKDVRDAEGRLIAPKRQWWQKSTPNLSTPIPILLGIRIVVKSAKSSTETNEAR